MKKTPDEVKMEVSEKDMVFLLRCADESADLDDYKRGDHKTARKTSLPKTETMKHEAATLSVGGSSCSRLWNHQPR